MALTGYKVQVNEVKMMGLVIRVNVFKRTDFMILINVAFIMVE